MQIQRIHDDHHPFSPPTGPHTHPSGGIPSEQGTVKQPQNYAVVQSSLVETDIAKLIEKLRDLPDLDDEVIQQALARFESGTLISREAANLVATSSLQAFVF